MTDVGFSSSAAGAQVVSSIVSTPQVQTNTAPSTTAAAARNIADSVAFSVEAQQATAVKAPERSSNSNAKSVQRSPQQSFQADNVGEAAKANFTSRVEGALTKMSGDVGSLMRMFGLSGEDASAVQDRFVQKMATKLGAPPEASLGMRAFAPFYNGAHAVEAKDINIQVQQTGGEFAVEVDFESMAVVPPNVAVSNIYDQPASPMFTTPQGVNVSLTTGSTGIIVDSNNAGARNLGAVISERSSGVNSDKSTTADAANNRVNEQRRREALGTGGSDPAETKLGETENAQDANRDGVADDMDSGFQSLLVVKTGSADPVAQGGTLRVQFDAIVPIEQRFDAATIIAANEATKAPKDIVTPASPDGFDVKA